VAAFADTVAVAVGQCLEEPYHVQAASSLPPNLKFVERERENNSAKTERDKICVLLYI
jgi:hypothetical protein